MVVISDGTVEVAPRSSSSVDIVLRGPQTDPKDFTIYSGFVQFTPEGTQEVPVISVPFVGCRANTRAFLFRTENSAYKSRMRVAGRFA